MLLDTEQSRSTLFRNAFQEFAKKKRETSEKRKSVRSSSSSSKKTKRVEEEEEDEDEKVDDAPKKKKQKSRSRKSKKKKAVVDSDSEIEVTAEIRRQYEASLSARREQTRSKEAKKVKKEKQTPAPKKQINELVSKLEEYTTPSFPWDPMYTTDPPGPICSRNFHDSHTDNLEQYYFTLGNMAKQATMFTVHINVSFLLLCSTLFYFLNFSLLFSLFF